MYKPTVCTTCSDIPDESGLWRMTTKVHLCKQCIMRLSGKNNDKEFQEWLTRQEGWKEVGAIE